VPTNEERTIYEALENVPYIPFDSRKSLADHYARYNKAYFDDTLPRLSELFICTFQVLPDDNQGTYIDLEKAQKFSTPETTVGLESTPKLEFFQELARIVLFHEMFMFRE
jgi:hypothetical protein